MPDEMIVKPAQNSGGVRAAAVFLSAHVLQSSFAVLFYSPDKSRGFVASSLLPRPDNDLNDPES
ncbi:MAG TPA: hypothetical protein VJ226_12060, partial [Bradyrhizobium sp.]|nr:hypothetical protein [Bradyrhizobium sp.]